MAQWDVFTQHGCEGSLGIVLALFLGSGVGASEGREVSDGCHGTAGTPDVLCCSVGHVVARVHVWAKPAIGMHASMTFPICLSAAPE